MMDDAATTLLLLRVALRHDDLSGETQADLLDLSEHRDGSSTHADTASGMTMKTVFVSALLLFHG